jgi:hypothetical protein
MRSMPVPIFFDIIAAQQQSGDVGIAAYAAAAEILGRQPLGQTAGVIDFDPVVEYLHHDMGARFIVVAMAHGVDHGFAQGDFGQFQYFLAAGGGAGDLPAQLEVLFKED